jgi:hypothetical protein
MEIHRRKYLQYGGYEEKEHYYPSNWPDYTVFLRWFVKQGGAIGFVGKG